MTDEKIQGGWGAARTGWGRLSLRGVAILEAFKGLLALLSGFVLFEFSRFDIQALVAEMARHLHLNPAKRYPGIFRMLADHLDSAHLYWLALAALIYSTLRLIEAYGLWQQRQWAWWMGLVSAAIYVPAEIAMLINNPGWPSVLALAINVIVLDILWRARQRPL